jgi:hypothetical protein
MTDIVTLNRLLSDSYDVKTDTCIGLPWLIREETTTIRTGWKQKL